MAEFCFNDFSNDLLALQAEYLDVKSLGSFGSTCTSAKSCISSRSLAVGILVREIVWQHSLPPTQRMSLYESLHLHLLIEGPGATETDNPKVAKSKLGQIKFEALRQVVTIAMNEKWKDLQRVVQQMFENAVIHNNYSAIRYLMSAGQVSSENSNTNSQSDDDEDEVFNFVLDGKVAGRGLVHAAKEENASLAWLLLKCPATKIIPVEAIKESLYCAATYGNRELSGCFLAYVCQRERSRKEINLVISKAMTRTARAGHVKLTVDLTTMLQLRSRLWQFRLAEERAERMRVQEERLRQIEEEANSRYFSSAPRDRRSPEAIARELAEIEMEAQRNERDAVFGVKDYKQALNKMLDAALVDKQTEILGVIFSSRIAEDVSDRARKGLLKSAVRKNDPDANNLYIEVIQFLITEKIVSSKEVYDLFVESVRRDAVYSVRALLDVNNDNRTKVLPLALLESAKEMANSKAMEDLLGKM